MDRVDVIVVGGGIAGLAAATALAQNGNAVRLYARGDFAGRPGGGIVAGMTLDALGGPAVRREVPFDRVVAERRWLFLSTAGDATFDLLDVPALLSSEELRTVRNSTLAPWLADRARTLGADLRPATAVTALRRDPKLGIIGVHAAGVDVESRLTILADGGTLPAVPSARPRRPTIEVAESFWSLPARTVSARFGAKAGAGFVQELLLGALSPERPAGGYLLPFRSGVAVGVVAGKLPAPAPSAEALLGRLERHPSAAPFLRDATRGPVARTELSDDPGVGRPLSGPGFLAVGRAGGLEAASGTRFFALDAALRSAVMAAEVAREAIAAQDTSAVRLASYAYGLRADGLLSELRKARASGRRYRAAPGVARDIPRFVNAALHELMTEQGGPKRRILPTVRAVRRREKVSRRTLLRAALVAERWR